MNRFTYYLLPGTGTNIGTKQGTAKDLLLDIPYLLNMPRELRREGHGVIPPLEVINDILSSGREDAGMSGGCKWEPFQINENDFYKIVSELTAEDSSYFRWVKPPDWVKTRDDWNAWKFELLNGGPAEEYKRLWNNLIKTYADLRAEEKDPNSKAFAEAHTRNRQADKEMTAFIMRYVNYKKN
jgi:hypothetical protein